MPFERVCTLSELPANSVLEALIRGEPYAVCNVNGRITALSGVCPHAGGPLGQGQITPEGRLICPFHMWEFDCATGQSPFVPSMGTPAFPVKVEGEDVLVDVP
jgi:nitrite reductase (NADH) small subunit